MYEFHGDKKRYFDMTYTVTKNHIIPYIEKSVSLKPGMSILEIGCGEAGVLKAFIEKGCQTTGIELEESRLEHARRFLEKELEEGKVQFLNKNIYDVIPETDLGTLYDVVILKDVIEHIPNQEKFMPQLHRFLKPSGVVFFAFPPWMMPYGGHQQVLHSKWAAKLPYYHLLPGKLYPWALKLLGVNQSGINTMEEIRSTGISIERFERICKETNFEVVNRRFYLFNPIYEFKFGIKPRLQIAPFIWIPWIRNFITMGMYYVVKQRS